MFTILVSACPFFRREGIPRRSDRIVQATKRVIERSGLPRVRSACHRDVFHRPLVSLAPGLRLPLLPCSHEGAERRLALGNRWAPPRRRPACRVTGTRAFPALHVAIF